MAFSSNGLKNTGCFVLWFENRRCNTICNEYAKETVPESHVYTSRLTVRFPDVISGVWTEKPVKWPTPCGDIPTDDRSFHRIGRTRTARFWELAADRRLPRRADAGSKPGAIGRMSISTVSKRANGGIWYDICLFRDTGTGYHA